MRQLTSVTILILAILSSSVPLNAQAPSNDWSRLNSLESGARLSIKLKSGKSVDGHLNSVSDSSISLKVKNGSQEVKREDVQTISRVTRKSATKATLIGLGVGAGVGAAIGAAGSNDSSFDKLDHAITAGLAVVGAGVGAISGYLIGRSGSKKELIYQAR
jgi:hypothetical protein